LIWWADDADRNLVERGLPDGLAAKTTYDETAVDRIGRD
jgi:hypothetical protein